MSRIGCLKCYDGRMNHCEGCNVYKIYNNIELYLDAFEKNTPKKPIANKLETIKDVYVISYSCPSCGSELLRGVDCCNRECRQAIDWTE